MALAHSAGPLRASIASGKTIRVLAQLWERVVNCTVRDIGAVEHPVPLASFCVRARIEDRPPLLPKDLHCIIGIVRDGVIVVLGALMESYDTAGTGIICREFDDFAHISPWRQIRCPSSSPRLYALYASSCGSSRYSGSSFAPSLPPALERWQPKPWHHHSRIHQYHQDTDWECPVFSAGNDEPGCQ